MNWRLHLRQISCFVEVARNGSIGKTAAALNVSQPAITKTIKELEGQLGFQLFTRKRTGVTLTAYGEVFLQHASVAIAELSVGLSELEALKNSEKGHVTIGGLQAPTSELVATAIARLKKLRPFIRVTVLPGTNDQLLPALKLGEVDIVFGRRGNAEQMSGLFFEMLFEDRLVFAASPHHPLARRSGLELIDLVDYPWIIPLPRNLVRDRLERIFHDNRTALPKDYVETPFGVATWIYMDATNAVAALPNNLIADEVKAQRRVVLLENKGWTLSEVGIARRDAALLSEPTRLMIQELRRVGAEVRRRR